MLQGPSLLPISFKGICEVSDAIAMLKVGTTILVVIEAPEAAFFCKCLRADCRSSCSSRLPSTGRPSLAEEIRETART